MSSKPCPIYALINKWLECVIEFSFFADGWEFELQAPKLDNKLSDLTRAKFIQVIFVTNIQALLEIFISLYELRRSTLQEVFLRPSEQFEAFNENDEFVQKNYVSVDRDYNVEGYSVSRIFDL